MTTFLQSASISANLSLLEQCTELIKDLPAEVYSAIDPPVFSSSIGAHLRHVLDHYDSLIAGIETGRIDYHHRQRDAETEKSPSRALDRIHSIRIQLLDEKWTGGDLHSPILLRVSADDPGELIPTSIERELHFGLSHTVHHFAMIGMNARRYGQTVPDDFGVAPSTLAHRKQLAQKGPRRD